VQIIEMVPRTPDEAGGIAVILVAAVGESSGVRHGPL